MSNSPETEATISPTKKGRKISVKGLRAKLQQRAQRIARQQAEKQTAQQAEIERLRNLKIGEEQADGSIFIGVWEPIDEDNKTLGKVFNVFAAPQNSTVMSNYATTIRNITNSTNGFDHEVEGKTPEEALYDAIKDDSIVGKWFMPTRPILQLIYEHENLQELRDTFNTDRGYWSCTTQSKETPHIVWTKHFANGGESTTQLNYLGHARLVYVQPLP